MNPVRTMALTEAPPALPAPTITPEQLDLIKRTIAKDATPIELELFLYDNARRGIHPLDKLLHFTKRGGKYTPVVSIDLLRSRAAATGDCGGQEDAVFSGTPMAADFHATVIVYRFVHGERCAFPGSAWWSEYKPDQDFMWRRMPHVMLSKCAEALALRKAFPAELAGLYAAEELEQAENRPRDRSGPAAPETVNTETGEITNELPPAAPKAISQAQRKRFFTIATKAGWTKGQIQDALQAKFQLTSTEAITSDRYDDICAAFEEAPPPVDPEAPF